MYILLQNTGLLRRKLELKSLRVTWFLSTAQLCSCQRPTPGAAVAALYRGATVTGGTARFPKVNVM